MSAGQLLVITKAPAAGRSKTRLTPPCSPRQAAAIAWAAAGDTLDAVRASAATRRVVALDGPPEGLDLSGCLVVPQAAGDLGVRLAAAFADAMAEPHQELPTLLIGTDTPQVTAGLLDACLARLVAGGPGTAALGAAVDGGWWALGLHSPAPAAVLPGVAMSRDDTARQTRRALEDAGVRVLELPELTDIDHFPDALAVVDRCDPRSRTRRTVEEVAARLASTPPPPPGRGAWRGGLDRRGPTTGGRGAAQGHPGDGRRAGAAPRRAPGHHGAEEGSPLMTARTHVEEVLVSRDGPRITLLDAASAPLLARPHFASGDPGPIVTSLAQVPELLGPTLPFLGAVLGPSWIPVREKEIVILRTSAVMGCRYCTEAHTVVALDAGLSGQEVRALRGELPAAEVFDDPYEQALITWCDAVAQGAESDIRQARQDLVVDDARVVELTLLVATTVMLNRYATALALPTPPDVRDRLLREGL